MLPQPSETVLKTIVRAHMEQAIEEAAAYRLAHKQRPAQSLAKRLRSLLTFMFL